MGRTTKSQGLAPPAIRKDQRAKQARHIINKVIPSLLASNPRARRGAEESELISDPAPVLAGRSLGVKQGGERGGKEDGGEELVYTRRKGQSRRKIKGKGKCDEEEELVVREGHEKGSETDKRRSNRRSTKTTPSPPSPQPSSTTPKPPTIRILPTTPLIAAHTLLPPSKKSPKPNPCILNPASPLRPGGGVLTGATSTEEHLCARTTLLPSLHESFYRLPELGGIFTPNVLVFRNSLSLSDPRGELSSAERWSVDVISAGMLRFPDLEGADEEEKRLGKKDRGVVEAKMRGVLRIACMKGVEKLVLGAWGCGAYGNPVRDIAEAWRSVIAPSSSHNSSSRGKRGKNEKEKESEVWHGISEIVFAIPNVQMARDFARAFGCGVDVEADPDHQGNNREDEEEEDRVVEELKTKISEMEGQIEKVWNPDLKHRMGIILDGLRTQLRERDDESGGGGSDDTAEGQLSGGCDSQEEDEETGSDDDAYVSSSEGSVEGKLKLPSS